MTAKLQTLASLRPASADNERARPIYLDLPLPPLGGKCWVMREKGLFVLEQGPGVLRTIACTHAGSGNLEALDGIPNADGFFVDEQLTMPVEPQAIDFLSPDGYEAASARYLADMKRYAQRDGRPLYSANPVVMGSWMLDAGFIHGLTLRVAGGHEAAAAIASVVWQPFRSRAPVKSPEVKS